MATSTAGAEESLITLTDTCSEMDNTLTQSAPGVQENYRCQKRHRRITKIRKWPFRSIGSSSLLLILTWLFIIQCSLYTTLNRVQYTVSTHDASNSTWISGETLVGVAMLSISCPIASILAEVAIGRYRLASLSLKAMWILSFAGSVISVCEKILQLTRTNIIIIQFILLLIPQYLLLGVFIITAIPLALDQINGGSNANISAFIQWLNWTFFSGIAFQNILSSVTYTCTSIRANEVSMIMSLLPILLLSVGLILDFCFHHKLVKEPVTVNPLSLIFKVLKYAAKHKYPVQRSAFTYCENEQPTRLDYGKSKYGGPFTTEQVEDVKTFWRVLLVILVITIPNTPLLANIQSTKKMSSYLKTDCIQEISHNTIAYSTIVMFFIPLYELLIYPCLRNRTPSILKSIGIGAAAVMISSLYGIVAESLRPTITNDTDDCRLLHQSHNLKAIQVSTEVPFNMLLGLTDMLLHKSYAEFICAQAPYNMNGLLIGILISLYYLHYALGTLMYEAWRNKLFTKLNTSRCGIWFYLTTLVLAVLSSALMGLIIRWYKARERDEITRSQDLVEQVYDKYIPGTSTIRINSTMDTHAHSSLEFHIK